MNISNFIGVFISATFMFIALGNGLDSVAAGFALAAMLFFQAKDQNEQ